MRSVAGALLVACACGRIGFDPTLGDSLAVAGAQADDCATCGIASVALAVPTSSALIAFVAGCSSMDVSCTPTVTDALGNRFVAANVPNPGTTTTWYACDAIGGSDTITGRSAPSKFAALHVVAIAGAAPVQCIETGGAMAGSGTSASTTSLAAVNRAPTVAVAFFISYDPGGTGVAWAAGSGFTAEAGLVAPFGYHATMTEAAEIAATGAPVQATATQGDAAATVEAAVVVVAPP